MSNTSAVPSFVIKVDGTRLPPDKEADVKEILIFEKTDAPSRFELTLNNEGFRWTDTDDIAVGSELNISIGYKDALEEMMVGDVTGIRANMRFGQANTVTYIGYSKSHMLLRGRKSRAFTEMTVTEIIEQIASDAGMTSDVEQITEKRLFTLQKDISDFNYLMSLADRYGCTITDVGGELGFKRQVANSGEDLVVEYNKTLVEFYPTTDLNELVTEVEVRGWDTAQHLSVRGTKTHSDASSDGGGLVEESFGAAKHALLDIRVKDQNEADQLALDYLTRNARNYIQGYGICVGDTDLRAGGIVKVEGIAERYKGKYYAWAVQHRLEIGVGYTSKFFISSNVATQGNASNTSQSSSPAQNGTPVGSGAAGAGLGAAAAAENDTAEDGQQPPEPEIINLKWLNMDDEEIETASVGDKIKLTAEVRNMDDGTWVRVAIYKKDYANEDLFLHFKSLPIRDGAIEMKWVVECRKDDYAETLVSGGDEWYIQPELLFAVKAAQPKTVLSEDSAVLAIKEKFSVKLKDSIYDEPLADIKVKLLCGDDEVTEAQTDDEGVALFEDAFPGEYIVVVDKKDDE